MKKANKKIGILVTGIKWDADTEEELSGISTEIRLEIPLDEYVSFDKDDLEEYISDKISDASGFCHNGWDDYSVEAE